MADGSGLIIPAREIVLPPNATPLERALAAIDGRLLELPSEIIRASKDPSRAPSHLLPHLAWERSVDVWDPAWPDDLKRRVILASYIVHRYKGTRFAVEQALEALGFATKITEWWQKTPQGEPYTFHVRAFALERLVAGQPVITEPMTRAVLASINAAKPVSRTFSFDIAAGARSSLVVAARSRALQPVMVPVPAAPPKTNAVRLSLAARGRGLQVAQNAAFAAPLKRPVARIVTAARARALQIVHTRMEAIAA